MTEDEIHDSGRRADRRSGGGVATSLGMDYQFRVAAWAAVRILAEQDASLLWDLPVGTVLESVRCEAGSSDIDSGVAVDDIILQTSSGGRIYIQAKRTLQLSSLPTSELGKTIEQFVRQFRSDAIAGNETEDPNSIGLMQDRLVIVVGSNCYAPVRTVLPSMLTKVRNSLPGSPIDEGMNEAEKGALETLQGHIFRAFMELESRKPQDQELRSLLAFMRLTVLSVEADGETEQAIKDLLVQTILSDPTQVNTAWSVLRTTCTGYCTSRTGGDRYSLQRVMISEGIGLQAARSYRSDIQKLHSYSHQRADLERQASSIHSEGVEIQITRPFETALNALADSGGLIVGEAGAGKTVALLNLFDWLTQEGRDVVLLSAGRISAQSLEGLQHELGLSHPFADVLQNWPVLQPGLLLIDALDAARLDQSTAQCFRDLLSLIVSSSGRWKVVAVIRKFDLRYSRFLQQFFRGTPPTEFADPEFVETRHLNVGRLSEGELQSVAARSPRLAELFALASQDLLDLLRVPFNLELASELLALGLPATSFNPIRTQVQLLDKYWLVRAVGEDALQDAREEVLTRAVEAMIDAHELRAARRAVRTPDAGSAALNALLTSHVLVEWQESDSAAPNRDFVAFSHHVVFDYAIARLQFRNLQPADLGGKFAAEPDLVISVRPSLVLHFQHVWERDSSRNPFWDLVLQLIRFEGVPEIGKLIGPGIAAAGTKDLSDLGSLFAELTAADPEQRRAAEHALQHLVGALSVSQEIASAWTEQLATPWCDAVEFLSRSMTPRTADVVRLLLRLLTPALNQLTAHQQDRTGRAARRLLQFAWDSVSRNNWMVEDAVRAVVRTGGSDPSSSTTLLRRAISPEHLAEYGHQELDLLARGVRHLVQFAPDFAEDVYGAAFSYQERSEQPTEMMGGQIMPMTSTRRQDYEIALRLLADAFPDFLANAPREAVGALSSVLEARAEARRLESRVFSRQVFGDVAQSEGQASSAVAFEFDGIEAYCLADNSYIWGNSGFRRQDNEFRIVSAVETRLSELSQSGDTEGCRALIRMLVAKSRTAFVWKRLLVLGEQSPSTLGLELRPLAFALPILLGQDTTHDASRFLKSIFPFLSLEERERIELTICAYTDEAASEEQRDVLEGVRDRHLSLLPMDEIVTSQARELAGRVAGIEKDARAVGVGPAEMQWVPTEDAALQSSIATVAEPATDATALIRMIERWTSAHRQTPPNSVERAEILPVLQELHQLLENAESDGHTGAELEGAWDILADACQCITSGAPIACSDEESHFVRSVLIGASRRANPVFDPQSEEAFDTEHPHWGGASARHEAALGLMRLAASPECGSKDLYEALAHLSRDPTARVRFFVVSNANALLPTAPELMWEILEHVSEKEERLAVLDGIVRGALWRLAPSYPDGVAPMLRGILDRTTADTAQFVRSACIELATILYVAYEQPMMAEIAWAAVDGVAAQAQDASPVPRAMRGFLSPNASSPRAGQLAVVRARAISMLQRLVQNAKKQLGVLGYGSEDSLTQPVPERLQEMKDLLHIVDSIGMELLFASGASATKHSRTDERILTTAEKQEFLEQVDALVDEIAEIGLPHTAHHLLEMLEHLIEANPVRVFLRMARVMRAGEQRGYQFEPLAIDLVVEIVERYLADYRTQLRANADCRRALVEILDIFVRAGWPKAIRLVYQLDEIYR
jgi:hypothetical protein